MRSKGVALVTGAAQGIGRAIAIRLAEDGFDVALNDLPLRAPDLASVMETVTAHGRACSVHLANVSIEEQVKAMVDGVVQEHGALDVMVANAGLASWGSLFDTTAEEFDRIFSVNVRGTFLCYKYAGKQMVEQGRGGRLIGASSVAGKTGIPFIGTYCASKFAVRGITQAAAHELGRHGITVNCYAPGAIDSVLLNQLADGSPGDTGQKPEWWLKMQADRTPLGRLGTIPEVVNLVSFLASKESQFITGQAISVNGGLYMD
ncbi:hypothetical protein MKEN_00509200 [Mycena kentingensis (nom. inval.)]|nr:hypothetical protein MKEN_00509200 [Mycena kentingensis (nom. inval.)]